MRLALGPLMFSLLFLVSSAATAQPGPSPASTSPAPATTAPAPAPAPGASPAAAAAAANARVAVCVPKDSSVLSLDPTRSPANVAELCANRLATPYRDATAQQPRIRSGDLAFVFAGDGTQKLGTLGVTSVTVAVGTSGAAQSAPPVGFPYAVADSYFLPVILDAANFPDASQGDPVTFSVQLSAGPSVVLYGDFIKPFSLYNSGSTFGAWIPVGLFGTNGQSNASGITLAALPVGVAWGFKWNVSSNFYLGLSAFGSWTIAPQKDSTGGSTGNYTLSAVTPGAFLDVAGYLYVGYGYAVDLRSGYANPGSMLVVGVGPTLLQFLKGQ